MDLQLDLRLEVLEALGEFSKEDYLPDFQDLWDKLEPGKITLVDQKMHFRDEKRIFVEKKILLPAKKLDNAIEWCHKVNRHPGAQRTLWFILKQFHVEVPTKKTLGRDSKSHCTMQGMRRSQAQHSGRPRVGRGSAHPLHDQ